jgi:hypothetical protein
MKHLLRACESIQWEAAFVQFDDADAVAIQREGPRASAPRSPATLTDGGRGLGPRSTPYPS